MLTGGICLVHFAANTSGLLLKSDFECWTFICNE